MRVYLASFFADKDRVVKRCAELNAMGIETTSRWASEDVPYACKITDKPAQYMRETAVADIDDILRSDKLVLTIPTPEELMNLTAHQLSRGGRNFESGFIYGLMVAGHTYGKKELIIMGKQENVFHFLDGKLEAAKYPAVTVIETWEGVKSYLATQVGYTDQA